MFNSTRSGFNNFGGDQTISGNNTQPITSMQGKITIKGDNNSSAQTMQGKIQIYGNNNGDAQTMQGKIEIDGDNLGSASTMQGKIVVSKTNSGTLHTQQGKIEVNNANNGKINTQQGKIEVGQDNNGLLSSEDGNIIVSGNNNGGISIENGYIDIRGDRLNISRESRNAIGSVINSVSGGININISGNSSVIINGQRIDRNSLNSSGKKVNKVRINSDLEIDFESKEISYNGKIFNVISNTQIGPYVFQIIPNAEASFIIVCGMQVILVSESNVRVGHQNIFNGVNKDFFRSGNYEITNQLSHGLELKSADDRQ